MSETRSWNFPATIIAAFLLPVLVAALLMFLLEHAQQPGTESSRPDPVRLDPVKVGSSAALAELFTSLDYNWPPRQPLPPTELRTLPDDLVQQPVDRRKSLFFQALAPIIAAENQRIYRQRQQVKRALQALQEDPTNVQAEIALLAFADDYGMDAHGRVSEMQNELLRRVDIVPPGLVLAQAANESAWGTSRFALEANNLFGMWTWDKSKGLKPKDRVEDASHYVRIFADLRSAVRNYLHTLNTGSAYSDLRDIRAAARQQGKAPSALALAAGLERYSQRGEEYVSEIRAMIRYNDLEQWRRFELRDETEAASNDGSTSD